MKYIIKCPAEGMGWLVKNSRLDPQWTLNRNNATKFDSQTEAKKYTCKVWPEWKAAYLIIEQF